MAEELAQAACPECGTPVAVPADIAQKGHRRFCNKGCQRAHYAKRFARWEENPQPIHIPTDIDVFLSADRLSCPVDGCVWQGRGLTAHANGWHGIPAALFKELCGLNRNTGVVTRELSSTMRENTLARAYEIAPRLARARAIQQFRKGEPQPKLGGPRSKEAILHMTKARHARPDVRVPQPDRPCRLCGKPLVVADQHRARLAFHPECYRQHRNLRDNPNAHQPRQCQTCGASYVPTAPRQRFCTKACHNKSMLKPVTTEPKTCAECCAPFKAVTQGDRRSQVCCNTTCQQVRAKRQRAEWKMRAKGGAPKAH